jgi:hypothetical protein
MRSEGLIHLHTNVGAAEYLALVSQRVPMGWYEQVDCLRLGDADLPHLASQLVIPVFETGTTPERFRCRSEPVFPLTNEFCSTHGRVDLMPDDKGVWIIPNLYVDGTRYVHNRPLSRFLPEPVTDDVFHQYLLFALAHLA